MRPSSPCTRSIHSLGCVKTRLLLVQPVVDTLARRVFGDAGAFLNLAFKLFALAESLGAVESLAEHPSRMTHASMPLSERERAGVGNGLIRLSVGVEDVADLIADLESALN